LNPIETTMAPLKAGVGLLGKGALLYTLVQD
jgi:hypothetical protein